LIASEILESSQGSPQISITFRTDGRHACDFSLIYSSASCSVSNPKIVSNSPPIIIVGMHPSVRRYLTLFGELDHMHGRRMFRRPA
jgi:hypothetical protein